MPNYVSKLSVDNVLALVRDTAAQTLCANLRNDLTAETSARKNADTALGNRVDAETSARESADTALGGRIDAETSARKSADNAIIEKINTITPEMYGAIGDGTTDDTDAMQTAINYSAEHNKILVIPAKTYKCRELTAKNNMSIIGVSPHNSVILLTEGSFHGDTNDYYFLDSAVIKNLRLKNGGNNLTGFKFLLLRTVIENCFADRFSIGFHMTAVPNTDWYQPKVDNGEMHGLLNCCAIQCNQGFKLETWDSIYTNIISSRCANGIEGGSCEIHGCHVWGFSGNGIIVNNTARMSNIEIEAAISTDVTPLGLFSSNIIINGLYMWNINISKSLIWCSNANNLQINNLCVGTAGTLNAGQDATEVDIISGTAVNAFINGVVDSSYVKGNGNHISTPCLVNLISSSSSIGNTIQVRGNSYWAPANR